MHVVAWKSLRDFGARYPDALDPLKAWFKLMEHGHLRNFQDLKRTFGSVDKAGESHVFDIGGNKYRLIAYLRFEWQRCYIKHVLTHQQYDKGGWKS